MEVKTLGQFIELVKSMRAEQRKYAFKHKYLSSTDEDKKREKLEFEVDKAIRERDKRLEDEQKKQQGELFG